MKDSNIEWTDNTFNPWIGCTEVSPGCANCYAKVLDHRMHYTDAGWGKGKPRHLTSDAQWRQPLKWDEEARLSGLRVRIFCASLADIFDDEVPGQWRTELWELVDKCRHSDWQILTKRPENIPAMLPKDWGEEGWPHVWLPVCSVYRASGRSASEESEGSLNWG